MTALHNASELEAKPEGSRTSGSAAGAEEVACVLQVY